jgi:hypothetical protein
MRSPVLRETSSWTPIDKSHASALGLDGQIQELAPSHPVEDIGLILNRSVWVEIPPADRWIAAFRLVNKGGVPVVAELRVFPAETDPRRERKRPAGQWRGEYGDAESVPRAGLTARLIHNQVRLGTFKDVLRTVLSRHGVALKSLALDFPNLPQASPRPATRGRKGRPHAVLAKIAAVYARAYLANSPPIPAVRDRFRLSLSQARDAVFRARTLNLLTPADKQGRAGGMLTPQARALLHQPKNKKPKAQWMKRRKSHGTKR